MRQPRRLSISEFSERDRLQANKALRLELKNRPHIEVANCLHTTEMSLIWLLFPFFFSYPIHLNLLFFIIRCI